MHWFLNCKIELSTLFCRLRRVDRTPVLISAAVDALEVDLDIF
jgi:hypothetical protein